MSDLHEEMVLRFLITSLDNGNYSLVSPYFADNCRYYGWNGRFVEGKDFIIQKLSNVYNAQVKTQSTQVHLLGRIKEGIILNSTYYPEGTQAIFCSRYQDNGEIICAGFLEFENRKISTLRFTYEMDFSFSIDNDNTNHPPMTISKTMDEWKEFIISILKGRKYDLIKLYHGFEPDCTLVLSGNLITGREHVYSALDTYINAYRFLLTNINESLLSLDVSQCGRIQTLFINDPDFFYQPTDKN